MKKIKKVFIYLSCFILISIILVTCFSIWSVYRAFPKTNGVIQIQKDLLDRDSTNETMEVFSNSGSYTTEIIRDEYGVPHIYADNEFALFFTQGYVHAQDRLWQMEINRRGSKGTLSEVFGKFTIASDRYIRTFGIYRNAEQTWMELDDDTKFMLESYAEGVNYYIETHKKTLPAEFKILGIKPEPWTPLDTIAWSNMMTFYMSYNHTLELVRAKMVARNGQEAVDELFVRHSDVTTFVPPEADQYQWLNEEILTATNDLNKSVHNAIEKWGSNNWVVGGSLTETGKPMLANDTHMNLGLPSMWYENGIHGGRYDGSGYTFPGVPLVVIGHNKHIAWGITNMNTDVQDLYMEKLDDVDHPTKYKYKDEWKDIDVVNEIINVKGQESVEHKVYITRHGPIINDELGITRKQPISLKWTLHDGSNLLVKSIMKVNQAQNWDEFRMALRYWNNASQNFVYADTEGNIGYQAACKVPIRNNQHQGTLPVPGWTGEYEWGGYIPFDDLPNELNPEEGYCATANNKIVSDDYPYVLSYDWSSDDRVDRIRSLLSETTKLTMDDMKKIQMDSYSLFAEKVRPYLLDILPEDTLQELALEQVKYWDLNTDIDSIGATIFETWYNVMIRNVFAEKLGIDQEPQGFQIMGAYLDYSDFHQPAMIKLLQSPNSKWFDDNKTTQIETRDDMISRSLREALNLLVKREGKDINKWKWGDVHTMTFTHMPLGVAGPSFVKNIFNAKKVPCPGSLSTINVAQYKWNAPFEVNFGSSQRTVIDMGNFDNTATVNSTGQTGLLFHSNRDDQIELWQQGKYRVSYFSKEQVIKNSKHELKLEFFLPTMEE